MSATMAARARTGASLSAPIRRAQPARRKSSWLGRVGRLVGQRPGRALLFLAFGIVSCAIAANALMFQKARHPAPMLSAAPAAPQRAAVERRAEPAPAQEAAPTQAAVPSRPPARPADLSNAQPAREAAPRPPAPIAAQPRTAQAATTSVPKAAPAPAPVRDPIADLINGGNLRPPADVKGVAARSAAAPRRSAEN
ncbi:conserved hypothetical protein [Hyphomicrobiales bacterium]|nr:conserved hypothetical protein [Hyphomicrobiales bacterium]CAH1700865.1 conserved hypothetical protein [Hyphomicrobiales bacterium]CAI0344740.1 conserved hypothetical protein [Hyphomicrobiales bacterium]